MTVLAQQRTEVMVPGGLLKVTAYPWGVEFEVVKGDDER